MHCAAPLNVSRTVLKADTQYRNFDLKHAAGVLWLRAPWIVGVTLLAGLATFFLSSLRADQYLASSTVRVVDPNAEAVFDGVQVRVDPKRDVETQLALLRSDDLRGELDQVLGDSSSQLRSVSAAAVAGTDLIKITAGSDSPQVAADAANGLANIYVKSRKEQVTAGFSARADELRSKADELGRDIQQMDDRLASLSSNLDADVLRTQRASLVQQQADLRTRATQFDVEATTRSGNVELAETASPATSPASPRPARDAALAAFLAALASVGCVLLLDRLDDRVRSGDDVERVVDPVPILGAIPVHGAKGRGGVSLPKRSERSLVPTKSPAAEAYRTLRTSLRFSQIGNQRKTLVVTSSDQSEGKSTVAANLAVTLAESGLRVVLVSADLRRPTLAEIFGVSESDKGLTTVLIGDASLAECLRPISLASGQSLYLLPAGPLPQNPAELLGSRGMRDVVAAIEQAGADYVLIDSPPVLPVSDAMALAQFADGVLLLAVANQTKQSHLAETLDRLRQVNADVVGVVVNGVPTRGRYGSYYGRYGYGGYSYRQSYGSVEQGRNGKSSRPRGAQPGDASVGPVPHLFADQGRANGNGNRSGSPLQQSPVEPNA